MNRTTYALFALLMGVFTSCSLNESIDDNAVEAVKVTVSVDEGVRTRATDTSVDRYVIEVYSDNTYNTPVAIFTDGTNRAVSAMGEFTLLLDRSKDYYCLLWADKAGATSYTVSDLKAVTLVTGQQPVEAWHGTLHIQQGASATLGVELKRAVAKLSLLETGVVFSQSKLAVVFSRPTVFNVATTVSSTLTTVIDSIDLSAGATGTKEAPYKLNTNDMFVLAGASSANVFDLTFTMVRNGQSEPSFQVTNVPFQANYCTSVKGHYTTLLSGAFTLRHDEEWYLFDE